MANKRIINLDDVPLSNSGNGKSFVSRIGRIGPLLESTGLGCSLTIVPPGKRAWPFHRHQVTHEMFYVLAGTGEYRIDGDTLPLRAGDLVAAPAGKEAHQIVNTSDAELRYLAFSTIGEVDIVEYPDSGKMAAAAGIKNADYRTASYKGVGRLQPADYFDGEEPK
jgi:uncharacterized cupin superfamily protein